MKIKHIQKLSILVLMSLFSKSAAAQQYNFSVSVGLGTATPLGDFGSLDADNVNAGGAAGGSCLDLELKGLIPNTKGIGTIFMLKTQANGVSKKYLDDAGFADQDYVVGAWSLQGYMGGAFYEFRTSEKLVLYRFMWVGRSKLPR